MFSRILRHSGTPAIFVDKLSYSHIFSLHEKYLQNLFLQWSSMYNWKEALENSRLKLRISLFPFYFCWLDKTREMLATLALLLFIAANQNVWPCWALVFFIRIINIFLLSFMQLPSKEKHFDIFLSIWEMHILDYKTCCNPCTGWANFMANAET